MSEPACLFCKIVAGDIPAEIVYEDDQAVAFRDIQPAAPTHLLIIPRKHLGSLNEGQPQDQGVLGHLLGLTRELAKQEGLSNGEHRVVVNVGETAGQTVFHLHLHLLGGRDFSWPPG